MNNNIFDMLIGLLSSIPVCGVKNVQTMNNVFNILQSLQQKMEEPEEETDNGG